MQNKAIFLDRDGVINKERGEYTYLMSDFQLNAGILEFCKEVQQKGYLLIIITNQGGLARNVFTLENMEECHRFMLDEFLKAGVRITELYYCPHHQAIGRCICRKPDSLMLEKAIARFNINKDNSWFIGDNIRDSDAAKKAGIKSLKVEPNENVLNYIDQF